MGVTKKANSAKKLPFTHSLRTKLLPIEIPLGHIGQIAFDCFEHDYYRLRPGFIVTLMHDTTEIVAAALLLAALDFYLAGKISWFGFLGALATLTRETSILALVGMFFFESVRFWREGFARKTMYRMLICGSSLVPYLLWRQAQHLFWDVSPTGAAITNLYWPMMGPLEALRDVLTGARASTPGRHWFISTSFDAVSIMVLLMFSALGLWHVLVGRRANGAAKALVFGWLPILALMMSLNPNGPWADPTAYFRAFTECFVIGSFILFLEPNTKLLRGLVLIAVTLLWIGAWGQTSLTRPFL